MDARVDGTFGGTRGMGGENGHMGCPEPGEAGESRPASADCGASNGRRSDILCLLIITDFLAVFRCWGVSALSEFANYFETRVCSKVARTCERIA